MQNQKSLLTEKSRKWYYFLIFALLLLLKQLLYTAHSHLLILQTTFSMKIYPQSQYSYNALEKEIFLSFFLIYSSGKAWKGNHTPAAPPFSNHPICECLLGADRFILHLSLVFLLHNRSQHVNSSQIFQKNFVLALGKPTRSALSCSRHYNCIFVMAEALLH